MPAEIKVISGGAMRRFLSEALPLFELASADKVSVQFGLTRDMKAAIEEGAPFDLALLPRLAASRDPGRAFVKFLASPEAVRIIRAKGMEPPA